MAACPNRPDRIESNDADIEPPIISVVIPSFNCAPWLERAVASTESLGPTKFEVIIIDDGSTDETPMLGAALAQKSPAIRYFRKHNGGLSSARNFGIERSIGKYIILLDADDELLHCSFSDVLRNECDVIRVGVLEFGPTGESKSYIEQPSIMSGRAYLQSRFDQKDFFTPSWAYIYRRSWLVRNKLEFMPGLIHEDNLFTVQALLAANTVSVRPEVVYKYIRRSDSITTTADSKKIAKRINSLEIICRELTNIANTNPETDFRWWIDQTIHNACVLAHRIGSRRHQLQVLRMQLTYMISYFGFARPGFRYIQRQRLKSLLFGEG